MKRLLHIGCGWQPLPEWLPATLFREVRVDVEPKCEPDFVRNMLNLHDIGTFDFIYSSHNIEHLYPYQVPKAFAEFMRVLNPGGAVAIVVPDLEDVRPTEEPVANCELGLICGLDMFYGHHSQLEEFPFMAHHCGFIQETLERAMKEAGFQKVEVKRAGNYNLIGTGAKIVTA